MRPAVPAAFLAALLATLLTLPAPAVRAQTPVHPGLHPGPGTLLRLSESAEVLRAPDEVRATLRAEAREATAAGAQSGVNRAMAAALEAARAVPGVTASTGAYRTWRQEDPARWHAGQSVILRAGTLGGGQAAALLELVGTLQARGLALGGIVHGLTPGAARAARQEAAGLALDALRRRAEALAAGLGMRVERIAEINLDPGDAAPRPMLAQPMGRAAAAPPVSEAEDIVVRAVAQAVVLLAPD